MKNDEADKHTANHAKLLFGLTLTLTLALLTQHAHAQQPADAKPSADSYQTLYLTNLTSHNDSDDIQSDLRNMLPNSKLFYVPSQSALSIRGSAEDISLAQKIVSDLDRNKKIYRLTYTITDIDNGKRAAPQHFSIIVASGSKMDFKQGSKVPLVIGIYSNTGQAAQNSQVQYQDVGLEIEASLNAYLDGVRLQTKLAESSVADEKSGVGAQDPIFRQTTFEGTSTLAPGKPLVLGSMDLPGSTRRQEVEVVAEAVR
jgi:type II secretory pathway component GspD/PulD (secretin)